MASDPLLLGLDIGGTKTAVVVGREDGQVIDRVQWPSQVDRGPSALINEVIEQAGVMTARHGRAQAAGVSIGGPMDAALGVIHNPPNLPGWDAIPLKREFEKALAMPVDIEHDAAACALAEYHWGAGRGGARLAYLTCGSGFGVGLVFDGRAYYGGQGRSIEIGHVRYRDDGPVAFGKQGCFEAFGAGNSLPKLAAWLYPARWGQNPPQASHIAQLADGGDEDAAAVIDTNATTVGDACALLGDLLFLELITLGSLGRYLGPTWLARVRQRFEQQVLDHVAQTCRIELAALGDRLQDCSALVVARQAASSAKLP